MTRGFRGKVEFVFENVFLRTEIQHKTPECRVIDLTARPASGPSLVTRCIPKTIPTLTNVTADWTVSERKSRAYAEAEKKIVKEF